MKIRTGFVSNSSSASFVASLDRLSAGELSRLLKYQSSEENVDGWTIDVDYNAGLVRGFTSMDNGAFGEWAEKNGYNKLRFEGGC